MEIDGAPWFVAQDAAAALGFYTGAGASVYTKHIDPYEKMVIKRANIAQPYDWPTRGFLCVSESGLYKLVMRSDRPEAKRFRDWVTRDVLPSIRKNGGYIAGQEKLNALHCDA
ncbi:BRO-N domain-containing protein [Azospirillum brasilense]|uniref:BRO-N domain-containing protein n=1 Tax=Azospirillum brasilense TaxID=192 RepID=UPI0016454D1F|nr:BRO family protein [Azospirillum brasilense]